jgi:acetyltransferase
VKNIRAILQPKSVAVIGASNRPGSLGNFVMANLLAGNYQGPVLPVNAKYQSVQRILCYESVADLPMVPDLAIICAPMLSIPRLIRELGGRGVPGAIVMAADPEGRRGLEETYFSQLIAQAAKPFGMCVLGPGSKGVQVPGIGLNASWIKATAAPGRLALVSQSGSLAASVVEWASWHKIGFSYVVSTGDAVDVDVGDLLDFLAADPHTRAVLLYIRSLASAQPFLSAARAIARIKPVIAIKPSRRTPRLASMEKLPWVPDDTVYDAVFRRAGMLRVNDTGEWFDAVETLGYGKRYHAEAVAVLCNGHGPGELAAAPLMAGGHLAQLADETLTSISGHVPGGHDAGNPVDVGRDAGPERYREAVRALVADPAVGALLVMHTPSLMTSPEAVARAVVEETRGVECNVMACWLGRADDARTREIFTAGGIPLYDTPEKAARAFLHLVRYRRNQRALMQTPLSPPSAQAGERGLARQMVEQALASGLRLLDEEQTAKALACYGFKTLETKMAASVDDAERAADEIGYPAALRLASPTVSQTFTVGNMSLDLMSPFAVRAAAEAAWKRFLERYPDQPFPGFVVQRMVRRPDATVLMAGILDHPVFGRLIRLGQGGVNSSSEACAVGLPPFNASLASEVIEPVLARNQGSGLDRPAIHLGELQAALVRLSEMAVELPEIIALDINPLLADHVGALVLDARIAIAPPNPGARHLAIRPYPRELEETITLRGGRSVLARPVRPEDEAAYLALLARSAPQDIYQRFCVHFGDEGHTPPPELLAKMIHIDYDREMTFVAMDDQAVMLGAVELIMLPDDSAEYSILVASEMKGSGLGRLLMEKVIAYCRSRGVEKVFGLVLKVNQDMLRLAGKLGFVTTEKYDEDEDMVRVTLPVGRSPP